jgi:DNA-binding transcriptional MerR regulator/methylmalonyl-CoA mutase cobalamin-binding subunit
MSAKPLAEATWSIADVERETGLGKDTLRVWERRYGFPTPARDGLGERVYSKEQLARLRLIKRLLDADHRPGKVVRLSLNELQDRLDELGNAIAKPKARQELEALTQEQEKMWVQWLANDQTHLIRQSLQQQILKIGLAQVVDKLVAPLCGLVGVAWMRGEISVYQEHLFTETLQSVLREAISSVDASAAGHDQRPRVLLTTTPNELHGLGLLMAECHFALESCTRFVLGTSTPISDIVQAVRQLKIDVLALSFSPYATRKDVTDNLQLLREQLPETVEIWVGGAGASTHSRFLPQDVLLLRKAGDVAAQLAVWRRQRLN